jgi:hypothetical protein
MSSRTLKQRGFVIILSAILLPVLVIAPAGFAISMAFVHLAQERADGYLNAGAVNVAYTDAAIQAWRSGSGVKSSYGGTWAEIMLDTLVNSKIASSVTSIIVPDRCAEPGSTGTPLQHNLIRGGGETKINVFLNKFWMPGVNNYIRIKDLVGYTTEPKTATATVAELQCADTTCSSATDAPRLLLLRTLVKDVYDVSPRAPTGGCEEWQGNYSLYTYINSRYEAPYWAGYYGTSTRKYLQDRSKDSSEETWIPERIDRLCISSYPCPAGTGIGNDTDISKAVDEAYKTMMNTTIARWNSQLAGSFVNFNKIIVVISMTDMQVKIYRWRHDIVSSPIDAEINTYNLIPMSDPDYLAKNTRLIKEAMATQLNYLGYYGV